MRIQTKTKKKTKSLILCRHIGLHVRFFSVVERAKTAHKCANFCSTDLELKRLQNLIISRLYRNTYADYIKGYKALCE